MPTPLFRLSATELAAMIRERKVSSVEVVQAHLNQIKKHNPRIHAVVTLCEDSALEAATKADEALMDPTAHLRKLHGVPILIKDSYRVKGIRSTFGGLPQYRSHVPASDCELVRRLRNSGAIILGRTNLPLLAFDWQSRNPLFREALNPFDLSRTPGGSSGGAASAIASGFAPLDLGSDLGGSIRYPCHCCGIFGLRTSEGLLPIADLGPEDTAQAFKHLVSCGPMARTLSDIRLMLEVLTDKVSQPEEISPVLTRPLRIAFSTGLSDLEADTETVTALENFRTKLKNDGHKVIDSPGPEIDFNHAYRVHGTIAGYELCAALPWFFKTIIGHLLFTGYLLRLKMGNGPFTQWISRGLRCSADEYETALRDRVKIQSQGDRFFEDYDLWILPNSPSVAIKRQRYGFPIRLGNHAVSYSHFLGFYLAPTAVMGTPALAFPIQSSSHLPMTVQIHAKRSMDFALLDFARNILDKHSSIRTPLENEG